MQASSEPFSSPSPAPSGWDWPGRLRAAGIHLGVSLCIAALAAALVFVLWYPYPYREISSGRELFLIVVAVDVVLGPLLMLAIFNRKKPKAELVRDMAIIGAVQLAALAYGLWTVFVARPVHLVFEYDRFRVIHAIDVPAELEAKRPDHRYPWGKPTTLGLREFRTADEQFDLTRTALAGLPLSARPELWQPYEQSLPQVKRVAKSVATLKARFPAQAAAIDEAVAQSGSSPQELLWLPMVGRKTYWTALIDLQTGQPKAFLPLDSF